jgi:hypothetical protein
MENATVTDTSISVWLGTGGSAGEVCVPPLTTVGGTGTAVPGALLPALPVEPEADPEPAAIGTA